ncbi:hypothetical protein ABZT26_02555 [Streptomyces sp. NPDC005395]|uniref:hypothetical protein n=1 Tax=unclassified Streptomyces TaxID=2593676 RepID=UPI001F28A75E|nr:hypothetical protein [Streptomyces sp. BSE6.1]
MAAPEPSSLAAELSTRLTAMERDLTRLTRMEQDLGEIKTACAVLVAQSTRTEQDVKDLRADMDAEFSRLRENELKPLKADVDATRARQWPLPSVAAVTSLAALGVALWQGSGK